MLLLSLLSLLLMFIAYVAAVPVVVDSCTDVELKLGVISRTERRTQLYERRTVRTARTDFHFMHELFCFSVSPVMLCYLSH